MRKTAERCDGQDCLFADVYFDPRLTPIACIVDLEGRAAARARYGLEMLLLPLGLRPVWTRRTDDVPRGIYYGPEPHEIPDSWIALAFSREAVQAFDAGREPHAVRTIWEGRTLPIGFPAHLPVPLNRHMPPVDLVAQTFFWLSGYQEHVIRGRDRHGRFPYSDSISAREAVPHVPVVDQGRRILAQALAVRGTPVEACRWQGRAWALCPTHDVDYLRKYRPGIWYRELVEYFVLGRKTGAPVERGRRLVASLSQALGADPFRRSITELIDAVSSRGGTATWFFKAGSHEPYDVPYSLNGNFIRRAFRTLHERGFEIGLHPSYFASVHPGRTRAEKRRLEAAVGIPVRSVRMHYLRYDPRVGPALHQESGFRIDSTLGFAEHEGFRRGTCLPFRVYDVVDDRPTDVWEFPLHVMDSTLFGYRGLDVEHAMEATAAVMSACRESGGLCIGLWHPVLLDTLDYQGWHHHFEETLETVLRMEGAILSLSSAFDRWQAFLNTP